MDHYLVILVVMQSMPLAQLCMKPVVLDVWEGPQRLVWLDYQSGAVTQEPLIKVVVLSSNVAHAGFLCGYMHRMIRWQKHVDDQWDLEYYVHHQSKK